MPRAHAVCEACGLTYRLDAQGDPKTEKPYTCDDCGSPVEVESGE